MQSAGFEAAIPASESPQTHATGRAATGAGSRDYRIMKLFVYNNRKVRIRSNSKGKDEGAWRRIVTDLPILNRGVRWYCVFLHVPAAINEAEIHQHPSNRMLDGPRG
jgi:hypothetical protein